MMGRGWHGDSAGHARAGRIGGQKSPGNFKRDRTRARLAGKAGGSALTRKDTHMAKVWYDAKTKEYKHENGRSVPLSDLRSLPHHTRAIDALLTKPKDEYGNELPVPAENYPQAELAYVEQILGGA